MPSRHAIVRLVVEKKQKRLAYYNMRVSSNNVLRTVFVDDGRRADDVLCPSGRQQKRNTNRYVLCVTRRNVVILCSETEIPAATVTKRYVLYFTVSSKTREEHKIKRESRTRKRPVTKYFNEFERRNAYESYTATGTRGHATSRVNGDRIETDPQKP